MRQEKHRDLEEFVGMAKSWIEKRDGHKNQSHVTLLEAKFAGIAEGSRLLISCPQEIDAYIRALPEASQIPPAQMRQELAALHKADATCPVSTGIFLRIVCEAALEERASGKGVDAITPFWRIDLTGSTTAKKLSIDEDELAYLRQLRP